MIKDKELVRAFANVREYLDDLEQAVEVVEDERDAALYEIDKCQDEIGGLESEISSLQDQLEDS